jgi:hypothetical protein
MVFVGFIFWLSHRRVQKKTSSIQLLPPVQFLSPKLILPKDKILENGELVYKDKPFVDAAQTQINCARVVMRLVEDGNVSKHLNLIKLNVLQLIFLIDSENDY